MIPTFFEKLFGVNYKTSLWSLVTAISLIPQWITTLDIEQLPKWLQILGAIGSFFGLYRLGANAKDKVVTGTGVNAIRQTK
jgi:hypothetical protein